MPCHCKLPGETETPRTTRGTFKPRPCKTSHQLGLKIQEIPFFQSLNKQVYHPALLEETQVTLMELGKTQMCKTTNRKFLMEKAKE